MKMAFLVGALALTLSCNAYAAEPTPSPKQECCCKKNAESKMACCKEKDAKASEHEGHNMDDMEKK